MIDVLFAFLGGALASLPAWILLRRALAQVEQLRCADLVAFADDELSPARAKAFGDHLLRCKACQDSLGDHVRLDAQLAALAQPREPG